MSALGYSAESYRNMIVTAVKFLEGGLGYLEAKRLPILEIMALYDMAVEAAEELED